MNWINARIQGINKEKNRHPVDTLDEISAGKIYALKTGEEILVFIAGQVEHHRGGVNVVPFVPYEMEKPAYLICSESARTRRVSSPSVAIPIDHTGKPIGLYTTIDCVVQ